MSPTPPGGTLRGREDEWALLQDALDRAAAGEYRTVWVEGAAGIGKTRLLAEAIRTAEGRGFLVAAAQADELEQMRPFGVVARALGCTGSAVDPRRAAIASLIATHEVGERGTLTVSSDPGLQFRVVDAFADLVEELAMSTPVLFALDDLQWADTSTLLVLNAIRRRGMGLPLAVVGCFRPVPAPAPLHRALQPAVDAETRQLVLGGLSEDSVHDLVAEVVDAAPGAGLLGQVAAAGGNPLFVNELVAALVQDGALRVADGTADIDTVSVPATLRMTVLRRLSHLSGAALEALRSASILGSRFTLTDLAVVTGRSVVELSPVVAEAITAQVLDDDGPGLRFRHDLIHEAVYGDIPHGIRTSLHREAAHHLADAGAPARAVAEQLLRAAGPGDVEAIDWLIRTAREMMPGFPDAAAELLTRALDLMDTPGPARDRLVLEQANSLVSAGRVVEAIASCHTLLHHRRDPALEFDARLRLGSALTIAGQPARDLEQLEPVLHAEDATPEQLGRSRAEAGTAHLWLGELDRAEERSKQARECALETGDEQVLTTVLATESVVAGLRGRFERAMEISDRALHRADASPGHVGHQYPLHATRGFLLLEMDRFAEARAALDTGRRLCEEVGTRWPLPTYQAYLGVEHFMRGEWDDAVSELETSAGLTDETGVSFASVLIHTVLALIRLHRGDLSSAVRSATAAQELSVRGPRHFWHRADRAEALLREAHGDTEAAHAQLKTAWEQCTASQMTWDYPLLGPDMVRISLGRRDRDLAREVTAAVGADPSAQVPSRRAAATRCRGLLEDDPVALADAAAAYRAADRPLDAALASEEAGSLFARRGQAARARDLLTEAGRIFEQLGAQHDLLRLDAQLRAAGMPRGRRGSRRRPAAGWASLTATERAVADLVADGLSNPQIGTRLFVSRRTVQTHVSHIFTKLGLSSRAQLASAVSRRRAHSH